MNNTKYVTKYAFTRGILIVEDYSIQDDGYLLTYSRANGYLLVKPKDWFDSLKDAKDDVEKKRTENIDKLKKRIKKMLNHKPKIIPYD